MKRNDSENEPTVPALDEMQQAKENLSITNYHGLCFIINAVGRIISVNNIYKRTVITIPKQQSFYELLSLDTQDSAKHFIDFTFSGMPTNSFPVNAILKNNKIQNLSVIAVPFSQEKGTKLVSLICHELSFAQLPKQHDLSVESPVETELKKQVINLQNKNKELARINSFLDEFVTGAAHDLRSPLVVLKTYPDLIRRFKDEQKKLAALDRMKKASISLENILNNMMEFVDYQKNDKHHIEELHFEEIFKSLFHQLSFELEDINPIFTTNFCRAPKLQYCKAHLNSIIYNLVSNAIKYRKEGNDLKIEITTEQDGSYILLKIKDNGIGMDLEQFGHLLFQPFKRLNTDRTGTGLGLSIIKNKIEINGGKIEVESKKEQGATFKVYLMPYQI